MAIESWIGSLVVETQGREFLHQIVQSVLLLVDNVQVVGQRSEQVLTPWHDHVSVTKRRMLYEITQNSCFLKKKS